MGFWYWFRVAIMCAGLVVCVVAIRNLNQVAKPYTGPAKGPVEANINLCPTRVSRLESGSVKVFQEGMDWYRDTDGAGKQALDDVAVEKWFSRNCKISGTRVSASADVHDALKVAFVSGAPLTLLESAGGEFEWMGLSFSSAQMAAALAEIPNLPVKASR